VTLWLDPRGAISRRPYFTAMLGTFVLGAVGLALPYRLSEPTWSFGELGWVIDHPVLALSVFEVRAGPLVAGFALLVWLIQAWTVLALSIRRCRDVGISLIFAVLVPAPGLGRLVWIVFCLLRKARGSKLEPAEV